jgi:hypothetical protein
MGFLEDLRIICLSQAPQPNVVKSQSQKQAAKLPLLITRQINARFARERSSAGGVKMKIRLIDVDGIAEERYVNNSWITNYVRSLIKNNQAFIITTNGGHIEFGCTCYVATEHDGDHYIGGSDDCPIHGLEKILCQA